MVLDPLLKVTRYLHEGLFLGSLFYSFCLFDFKPVALF